MNGKEIVWLPKDIAAKLKGIEETKLIDAVITEYIKQSRQNIRDEISYLDDDVLQFKAAMTKAKIDFSEAKDVQLSLFTKIWQTHEDDIRILRAKVSQVKEVIAPLRIEIEQLKGLMGSVRMHEVDDLLKTMNQINNSFYGETGNILRFLFDNYKNPKAE